MRFWRKKKKEVLAATAATGAFVAGAGLKVQTEAGQPTPETAAKQSTPTAKKTVSPKKKLDEVAVPCEARARRHNQQSLAMPALSAAATWARCTHLLRCRAPLITRAAPRPEAPF